MPEQTTLTIPYHIAAKGAPAAEPRRGWAVFNAGEPDARIERYDVPESVPGYDPSWIQLPDDPAAWAACVKGAQNGDPYCLQSLAAVPEGERRQISEHTGVRIEVATHPEEFIPWIAEVVVPEEKFFTEPNKVRYTFLRKEAVTLVREAARLADLGGPGRHGELALPAGQLALWVTDEHESDVHTIDDEAEESEEINPLGTLVVTPDSVDIIGIAKNGDGKALATLCTIEDLKTAFGIAPDEIEQPKPSLYITTWQDGTVSLCSDDRERANSFFRHVTELGEPAQDVEPGDVANPVKMTLPTGDTVVMSRIATDIGRVFFDLEETEPTDAKAPGARSRSKPR